MAFNLCPPFISGARADVREQRGRVHTHLRAAVRNDPQLHSDEALRLSSHAICGDDLGIGHTTGVGFVSL